MKKSDKSLQTVIPKEIKTLKTDDLPALAASLVHEAKNPLAAIHLHLQLLEGYIKEVDNVELKDRLKQKVTFIQNEIVGLDKSLHNFMQLIRQNKPLQNTVVDLNRILQSVVLLLTPQANQEKIRLEIQAEEFAEKIKADEGFVKQISINLILNAIQAFLKNDKLSTIMDKRIIIKTGVRDNFYYMMVADNGPGISDEQQKKIFEPWYTTKTNTNSQGSGLGLALVKKMVAEMGAHLEIQSKIGKGTSITILFPKQ